MAKKLEFEEWIEEVKSPSKRVYIITGASNWKREFLNHLRKYYNCDYQLVHENFDRIEKSLKYRNIRYKKNLVLYEPLKNMNMKDLNNLVEYARNPSEFSIVIIGVNDWKVKKALLGRFRNLQNSKYIKLFDLDYPSRKFLTAYSRYHIDIAKLKFENNNVKRRFIDKIVEGPEEIKDNIEMMVNFEKVITIDMVNDLIEDYNNATYQKLFNTVTELNRKKVPFQTYIDLIDSDKKEITIMINLRKYVNLLYQAKYLKVKGILMNNDIIERKKRIYDAGDLKFPEPNIWDEPEYKINMLLKQCDMLSIKEIVNMQYILDSNINYTNFDKKKDDEKEKDNKPKVFKNTNIRLSAALTLFELLDRRNEGSRLQKEAKELWVVGEEIQPLIEEKEEVIEEKPKVRQKKRDLDDILDNTKEKIINRAVSKKFINQAKDSLVISKKEKIPVKDLSKIKDDEEREKAEIKAAERMKKKMTLKSGFGTDKLELDALGNIIEEVDIAQELLEDNDLN